MSIRTLITISAVAVGLTACAPTMEAAGTGHVPTAAFSVEDFAWSALGGNAVIDGRVAYTRDGQSFDCTGSVGLTPDTPYTRHRFQTLYGSTEQAAIPEAVVRARTVPDPGADYRSYVRSQTCQSGRFRFSDLPEGGWFLITPVSAGGERVILMRHVVTRTGTTANVTL